MDLHIWFSSKKTKTKAKKKQKKKKERKKKKSINGKLNFSEESQSNLYRDYSEIHKNHANTFFKIKNIVFYKILQT